jgi:hypothetical protein
LFEHRLTDYGFNLIFAAPDNASVVHKFGNFPRICKMFFQIFCIALAGNENAIVIGAATC